jgi:hypothetical protein
MRKCQVVISQTLADVAREYRQTWQRHLRRSDQQRAELCRRDKWQIRDKSPQTVTRHLGHALLDQVIHRKMQQPPWDANEA